MKEDAFEKNPYVTGSDMKCDARVAKSRHNYGLQTNDFFVDGYAYRMNHPYSKDDINDQYSKKMTKYQGKSDLRKCESRTTSYVPWALGGIHLGCSIHLHTTQYNVWHEFKDIVGKNDRRNPVVAQCGARDHFLRPLGSGQYTARPLNPSEHQFEITIHPHLILSSKKQDDSDEYFYPHAYQHSCYTTIFTAQSTLNRVKGGEDNVLSIL